MASDLFGVWLPALWDKSEPPGKPPVFMMHRFLASEADLAEAARVIQRDIRDDHMAFKLWQALLPQKGRAPRLAYVAPKKPPAEEALVARYMAVEDVRRSVAEAEVSMILRMNNPRDVYIYYGVEFDSNDEMVST